MLESVPVMILVGTVLGFLSGLGIGGGTLLILWLTLVLDVPTETARAINLMFFVPCALIACLFRWKQGVLEFKSVLPAILAGIASALLFTWLRRYVDAEALRKPFGFLLLVTGLRELFYRPRKAK